MSSINTITVAGNLTADPELRRTSTEIPYVKMRVAVSHRVLNPETKEWEDRQDGFFAVTAWRDLAVHARTSLRKGDRVTVTGKMLRRPYEADLGNGQSETRHYHEIEAEDLGPSLRWRAWTRLEPRPVLLEGEEEGAVGDLDAADDATEEAGVTAAA